LCHNELLNSMKKLNKLVIIGLFLVTSTTVFADGTPPPPGPPNPPVPIAGAVLGLFVVGAAYGVKNIKNL